MAFEHVVVLKGMKKTLKVIWVNIYNSESKSRKAKIGIFKFTNFEHHLLKFIYECWIVTIDFCNFLSI